MSDQQRSISNWCLIFSLATCALSLSLAAAVARNVDCKLLRSPSLAFAVRSVTPAATLFSGLLGVVIGGLHSATCNSLSTQTKAVVWLCARVHRGCVACAALLIVSGIALASSENLADKVDKGVVEMVGEVVFPNATIGGEARCICSLPAAASERLASGGGVYPLLPDVVLGLTAILLLLSQALLIWFLQRGTSTESGGAADDHQEDGKTRQWQRQQLQQAMTPVTGHRIAAANRNRRPPTSAATAKAAASAQPKKPDIEAGGVAVAATSAAELEVISS